jgi:hypothetical protein
VDKTAGANKWVMHATVVLVNLWHALKQQQQQQQQQQQAFLPRPLKRARMS